MYKMDIYKSSTSSRPTIYTFTTGILEGVHTQDKEHCPAESNWSAIQFFCFVSFKATLRNFSGLVPFDATALSQKLLKKWQILWQIEDNISKRTNEYPPSIKNVINEFTSLCLEAFPLKQHYPFSSCTHKS